ncbi:MAG: DNA polymerase III subunit gamma/tau [Holosporaceae bacterium]|jgi:DNA polymerase-3 subunit gamma/tau|nr:DNA polymerase III subunit gamma/tau [Holosporaceae bacterium]
MEVYVPLATRYRPRKFADIVGQDITVKIITRGMLKDRLGAALLFAGTRGVGKTTLARVLARAYRCENRADDNPEPCYQCESCASSLRDSQIDVVEIDAASNTSVDDIREVIESSRYRPTTGKFKIFIIDEVHMLSKSAFNALLKTLEEPPPHVKFFFATTETHRIPETIISRVLRFDLRKLDHGLIAQHLSSICNQERICADADVLTLIAKAAEGSIRDGLSILDQAINLSEGNKLSLQDVRSMLNISGDDDMADLLELILTADMKGSVGKYREILRNNVPVNKIINMLLDFMHTMVCIKTKISPLETLVSEEILQRLEKMADKISQGALSKIWQMLLKGVEELRFSDRGDIILEMLLIRIIYVSDLPDLQELAREILYAGRDKICQVMEKPAAQLQAEDDKRKALAEKRGETTSLVNDALLMFSGSKIM